MNQKSTFLKELEELRLNKGDSNKCYFNYTDFFFRKLEKLYQIQTIEE